MADSKKVDTGVTSSFGEDSSFQDRQAEARQALKESEAEAADTSGLGQSGVVDETPQPLAAAAKSSNSSKRRKTLMISSSSALVTMVILFLAVSFTVLLAPSLLLLNMKEKLSNDLNDALGYYYTTAEKVMAYQLDGGSGCDEHGNDSIQCKFSTMSGGLKDRYTGYEFEVTEGDEIDEGEEGLNTGRFKVSGVKFPGSGASANAGNLYDVANESEINRHMIDRVFNPSKGIFHSRGYIQRLYDSFHIQQSKFPSGLTNEQVVETFNQGLIRQADYIDENGRGVFGLHHLSETEDELWYRDIYDNLIEPAKTHLALACSMYTYADLGENTLRQAKLTTLARFAMQYMALSDSIKAGRTMQLEQVIGTMAGNLNYPVEGGSTEMSATEMSSYRSPTFHEAPDTGGDRMMHDLEFMLDYSPLLQAVQGGGAALNTSSFLRSIIDIVPTDKDTTNVETSKARELCAYSGTKEQGDYELESPDRCWLETAIPTSVAFGPKAAAAVMATYIPLKLVSNPEEPPCLTLDQHVDLIRDGAKDDSQPVKSSMGESFPDLIRSASEEEAQLFELAEEVTEGIHSTQTMDAIFTGTGVILGDLSQWLGMQPASTDSLQQYLETTAPYRMLLADQAREQAKSSPFDITNPYSFIGSTVSGLYAGVEIDSITSALASAVSLAPRAMANVLSRGVSATTGSDVSYIQDRLMDSAADCGIENIQDLINPDFSCAFRWSVSEAVMNLEVADVLDFMTTEDNADDAAKANSEEIQERNTDNMGDHGERMKTEDSEALPKSFVDPLTGKPNRDTEYWKFKEYCSDRRTPWGSLGVAVSYQEEEYIPDAKDQTERRTHGKPYYLDLPPEEEEEVPAEAETPEAETAPEDEEVYTYYANAWGGSEDYKWMTGEKCLEDSEMLNNFRAYTAMCAIHAATSGAKSCWHHDSIALSRDDFPAMNGIMYVSE